ncbi:hypothetical protein [Solidesulfovibrio sp.]
MRLERVETLPQGTPVFEVAPGLKDCRSPGAHLPRRLGDQLICPGCAQTCHVPAAGIQTDQHFVVRKRPSLKGKR